MKIVSIASEATPFIKSGGLADVLGSLPKAFQQKKQECVVILPKYQDMADVAELTFVTEYDVWVGWRKQYCGIFTAVLDNVTYYFISNDQYFGRPGLYGYDDDYERFAFFDIAAIELLGHLQLQPDVVHVHDWQTAMIPVLYKEKYWSFPYYENYKFVFTIHNIAYQGKGDPKIIKDLFALDQNIYDNGNCRHDDCLNMMKAALVYSDKITTVSPTYANEILTANYGEGLQDILQYRKEDLVGIINGIDVDVINPKTNPDIVENFDRRNYVSKKKLNKAALQKECGLPIDADIPCIGMVTRLTWQKGVDLVINQAHTIMKTGAQFILLGAGDYGYEEAFADLERQYPKQFSFQRKYDEGLSMRIYASSDIFLMPSLFEPCGLSQMMSLRFGTIPVVRETGGLYDSVDAYNEFEQTGNGFRFSNYNAEEMMATLNTALTLYKEDKKVWKMLMSNAMKVDFSWKQSADKYLELFQQVVG